MHVSGRNIRMGHSRNVKGGAVRLRKNQLPDVIFSNSQLPGPQSMMNPQRFTSVPGLRITEGINGMSIIEPRNSFKKKGNIRLVL